MPTAQDYRTVHWYETEDTTGRREKKMIAYFHKWVVLAGGLYAVVEVQDSGQIRVLAHHIPTFDRPINQTI